MKILLFMIIFGYMAIVIYFYFTQDAKIFNISEIEQKPPIALENVKHISLRVNSDVILAGVYKKSYKKDAVTIIYFGGNSDDATRFLLYVKSLNDCNIVAFNYRGYMKSTGMPSEKNLFSDALKIYDKFSKNSKIILIGRSLGTGVASFLASKREVFGVMLITPYDSIASLVKDKYPFLPVDWMLKYRFESIKYIQKTDSPIAIIEVQDDKTVPNSHTAKLMKKIKNLALHVELKDTTHADVLNHPRLEKIIKKAISKF